MFGMYFSCLRISVLFSSAKHNYCHINSLCCFVNSLNVLLYYDCVALYHTTGVSTLCQCLSQQRLRQVSLASTAVSSKCSSKLSELLLTPSISASLHMLDLSGNSFKGDDYLASVWNVV